MKTYNFYKSIGELKSEGEEFECAKAIDQSANVQYWVRNLERQPDYSFTLPTSTDLFYPDFVMLLKDGRVLVIEYKGAHLLTSDDTKEKNNIGQLWEEKSDGKALFLLATKTDDKGRNLFQQIEDKISKG